MTDYSEPICVICWADVTDQPRAELTFPGEDGPQVSYLCLDDAPRSRTNSRTRG